MAFDKIRRFGLGVLGVQPEMLGEMIVGDFLDAYVGYCEAKAEEHKRQAALIRAQTAIMVNIQLPRGKKITPRQLWPFEWEEEEARKEEYEESRKAIAELKRLKHGNGNI